ncbi:hypothetical protein EMIHUDRAFT_439403 [Emiliania huxleyi CCMP1516]|uniref:Uncharacterized protein n=2 Tax=Emiliania huxleyi TaxID=2903 RepID=A0A0D3HXP8_EMIH1|nr:hypothetical protein EMIHUDRAFT_439403 [Emiliania huxleyi CCMP1516]EOD03783.1 hypothetical protein EMIHUDRAFT_439403 [Emiliania huxleyi CCMP1516]|eukprot:XP_005756212.1 hypothetical protein EMIHUDRAFT_439403 [Emiliania huxleyi CCMP1516]
MLSRAPRAMRGLALGARMMSKPSVAVLGSGPTAAAAKAAVGEWATVTDSANSAPYVLVVDGAPGSVKADAVVAVPTCADAAKLAAAVPTAKVVAVTAAPAVAAAAELASKAGVATSEAPLPLSNRCRGDRVRGDQCISNALALGTDGACVSMGVPAVGDFGTGTGVYYSVPVVCTPGDYKRVGGITLSPPVAAAMEASRASLAGA